MIQNLSEALQRLPPDEQRAFTADFPKLLIEWYRGDAMYQTFQPVHARTGSRVTASRWDQQTFAQFVHSIRLVSAALDVPNATLFRGVTLPEYSAPAVSKTKIDLGAQPIQVKIIKLFYQELHTTTVPVC